MPSVCETEIDPEQGGTFTEEEVRQAQKDPLLEAKLAVRRWDDLAKVPKMETFPLGYYERMAAKSLLSMQSIRSELRYQST